MRHLPLLLVLALGVLPLAVVPAWAATSAAGQAAPDDGASGSTNPPPEGDSAPPDAQLQALAGAIAKNGCVVTMANQEQVLTDAGLDPLQGANVLDWLVRGGKVVSIGVNAFRLEGCKP